MPREVGTKDGGVLTPDRVSEEAGAPEKKSDDDAGGPKGPRIRCPRCGWRPRAQDRWMCHCHHVWNTFDTGGVCPGCLYQWKITQCLACGQMSPHSDWYAHD